MRMCNKTLSGAFVALVILAPVAVGGADEPPPYTSATEAYRQGASAMKSGRTAAALPALQFAAERGVLGAQLKLARLYAAGRDVPKDDAKAFSYFQQIANQHADISPSSPVAKYVGEAFVAVGQYYVDGVPAMPLAADPAYASSLFRHAASYFGSADAQYRLARLYLDGDGVERNVGLAANWLAAAAKKQHVASQATLGGLLWRGDEVRQRQARGLALITLAHQNAKAAGREPQWIDELYREAFAKSDTAIRKEAQALLPELGGPDGAATATAAAAAPPKAKASESIVLPASDGAAEPVLPAAPAAPAGAMALTPPAPAPIGLSVGFGAGPESGDIKP